MNFGGKQIRVSDYVDITIGGLCNSLDNLLLFKYYIRKFGEGKGVSLMQGRGVRNLGKHADVLMTPKFGFSKSTIDKGKVLWSSLPTDK